MKRAIFPGSFDPFHEGHSYIVNMALDIFDKVIICIAINSDKTPFFPYKQREDIIKEMYKDNDRVEVVLCDGLVAMKAAELNATAIIKGVRDEKDFGYEMKQADCNMFINHIPTIFIPSPYVTNNHQYKQSKPFIYKQYINSRNYYWSKG